jgi:hypothetical protein
VLVEKEKKNMPFLAYEKRVVTASNYIPQHTPKHKPPTYFNFPIQR